MEFEKKWENFSHGADIGVRGYGKTLNEAFAMGATALTAVITDPNNVKPKIDILISSKAPDIELLFVDWLNALIYEIDTRAMLFSSFDVVIKNLQLTAHAKGEPIDRNKHHPAVDIKGATYTALKVAFENGLWIAQCVVDV